MTTPELVLLVTVTGLLLAGLGFAVSARLRRPVDHRGPGRSRQMTQLIEHAQCVLWEAEVTMDATSWMWRMTLHPSSFCRQLFREGKTQPDGDIWSEFKVANRQAMEVRARRALEAGQAGYEQEIQAEREGRTYWLKEIVSITPLGRNHFWLVGLITDVTAQREAERARQQSELTIDRILAHADCLLWRARVVRSPEGRLDWVHFDIPESQLKQQLFGDRVYSVEPGFWATLRLPEKEAMDRRSSEAILADRPGYEQQFPVITKQGRFFWLHEKVSITRTDENRWSLVGVITDTTVQHQLASAQRASEQRLSELMARAECLLWEATVTATPQGWHWDAKIQPSLLYRRLTGAPSHAAGAPMWPLERVPERSEMDRRVSEALATGRPGYEQVFRFINQGGEIVWIRESVTIHAVDDTHFWLVGIAVDITPQRRAEHALAAEKERLAVTLRAMHEAVITTDTAGRIQYMNPAAARLTGRSAEGCVGQPVAQILRLDNSRDESPVAVPYEQVASAGVVVDLPPRTRLLAEADRRRQVEGCCAPILTTDRAVSGIVVVLRDVTEQERLEQELVRATHLESVGVLAGGIAHDFNNILTAVMGNLALAQLDLPPDTAAAAPLRAAEKAALRARDLTQQLLTFAKGGEPVRASVQLDSVVREVTAFALHGSQVKAGFDLAPDLWPADADKGQIGRVVQNIAINAVQAMPDGGTLRVTARNEVLRGGEHHGLEPGPYLLIAITDTGTGIAPEHLGKIFDPYFTTKKSGTGLGLAAAYSIVKKHRGHIEVESQVGQGTTFRIWLPATDRSPVVPESRAPAPRPALAGRVLLMDDEQIIRDMASTLMRRLGLTVDCAEHGEEAVAKYRAALAGGQRYDLVVMDLTVPGGMGGLQALRELRLLDPEVRAIVSSGYSSDPVMADYREHGFAGRVAKPYEIDEFADVLRAVLAGN